MTSLFVSPSTFDTAGGLGLSPGIGWNNHHSYSFNYSNEDLPALAATAAAAAVAASGTSDGVHQQHHSLSDPNLDPDVKRKSPPPPSSSFMSTLSAPRSPMSPPRHPTSHSHHPPYAHSPGGPAGNGHPPAHLPVSISNLQEKNLQLSRALSISKKMHELERAEYDHKVTMSNYELSTSTRSQSCISLTLP